MSFRLSRCEAGFTLMEVVIALSIFAVMSVGAYNIVNNVLAYQKASKQQITSLQLMSTMFRWLEDDLKQAIARPVRGKYGGTLPAFEGYYDSFSLTHTGWANLFNEKRSTLQRTNYALASGTTDDSRFQFLWVRESWIVLDQAPNSSAARQFQVPVQTLRFRYLDPSRGWQSVWPVSRGDKQEKLEIPVAVEVLVETEDFGEVRRLFFLDEWFASEETEL